MWIIDMPEEAFSFPEDKFHQNPLHIPLVGMSRCNGDYYHTKQNKRGLAIEYVIKGEGTLHINSLTYYPKAGDVYILHEYSSFEAITSPRNPWVKLWLCVDGSFINSLVLAYNLNGIYHIENCPVQDLFERYFQAAAAKNTDKRIIQNKLVSDFYKIVVELSSIVTQRQLAISDEALRVKNYLDNHIEGQVSLKELSDLTQKSQAQTIRLFKREIGITPYAYFLNKKIEQAKILLYNSNITIKDIAARLCFNDEYYFSNIFKQKTGLAPLHYRRKKTS